MGRTSRSQHARRDARAERNQAAQDARDHLVEQCILAGLDRRAAIWHAIKSTTDGDVVLTLSPEQADDLAGIVDRSTR
jgi:hypothetical protein